MKEALVVFAKAPIIGQVKTRLIGALTPEQVTALYMCFLQDTFAMMEEVQSEREELSLVLCYTPADEIEAFETADLDGCLVLPQQGLDLGERLQHCCEDLVRAGFERIVIIGADTPALPVETVIESFEHLTARSSLVLGPTTDGGYYLVGLRQPQPQLFVNIDWGTEKVLQQTQARAAEAGLALNLLMEWSDVDTPEDLERLQQQIFVSSAPPRKTTKFLQRLLRKS